LQESKLDIMDTREEQLKVLVPYLKGVEEGKTEELPMGTRTRVLISRYLYGWRGLYNRKGLLPKGALLYYLELMGVRK